MPLPMRRLLILALAFLTSQAWGQVVNNPNNQLTTPTISGTVTGTYTLGGTPTFSAPSFTSQILTEGGRLLIGGHDTTEVPNALVGAESTCLGDKACSHATNTNITAIGHNAVGDSGDNPFTGANLVAIGVDAMRNPRGGFAASIALGTSALRDWNSNFSIAIGVNTMRGLEGGGSTGDSNVAIGNAVFSNNASGITATRNIAIGDTVGPVITTANDNVWLGHHVATLATTAQKNIWLGSGVGAAATGMFESVLVGYNSGHALTGNSNTFVGDETGLLATSANNNTVVGHKVGSATLSSGSNILLLGTGTNTDSNTSNSIHIGAGGADIIAATGTGTNTTAVLTLHGSGLTFPDITTGTNADVLCVDAGLVVRLQAAASCTISSMRFKRDIQPVAQEHSLRTIMGLRTSTFYRLGQEDNPDRNATRQQIGLIAEDVAQVEPRLAIYEPDMRTVKSWHLDGMIAELVGAVQAQQREIDGLRRYMGYR